MTPKTVETHTRRLQMQIFKASGRNSYATATVGVKNNTLSGIIDGYLDYYNIQGKDKDAILAALRPFIIELFKGEGDGRTAH